MRWSSVEKPLIGIKGPEIGDTKKEVKFAWIKTWIETLNGVDHGVWFEWYFQIYEYKFVDKVTNPMMVLEDMNTQVVTKVAEWVTTRKEYYE